MMAGNSQSHSWWQTLPGILTATAAIVTAIGGLLAVLFQYGIIGGKARATPYQGGAGNSAVHSNSPDIASSAATPFPGAGRSWSTSQVVITTQQGVATTLRAETLSNCISVNHVLTLGSGQDIAFENMKSFEVLHADAANVPNARATVVITLLDGKTMKDVVDAACDIFGYNDLGRFTTYFQQLKRVDFQR